MGCSSKLEQFLAGAKGSASGPNIIEEEISGVLFDGVFRVELVGGGGLSETGSTVGADLGSIVSAEEKWLRVAIGATKNGKAFSKEFSMVEATSANMAGDGGERHNSRVFRIESGENGIYEFSEGVREGTDGLIFVAMDNII